MWQAGETWLVAAFIRQQGGRNSAPVELLRSRKPIRSVSYFPSPDTNTGRLGLVVDDGKTIALVSLDWDHDADDPGHAGPQNNARPVVAGDIKSRAQYNNTLV